MMCADLMNLEHDIHILEKNGVDMLHIDVMDATFVPSLGLGPDFINAMHRITKLPLDIHLMMEHPHVVIPSINLCEGDYVSIHNNCKDNVDKVLDMIVQKGAKAGLVLSPTVPIESVATWLPRVSLITLMLVTPGFAGGKLIDGIMEKVGVTRKYLDEHHFENIEISVDGSVSCERAAYMRTMGASVFVGGTAGIYRKGMQLDDTIPVFLKAIR